MNSILPGDREPPNNLPHLLTTDEVASALRISVRSVWRLVSTNKLVKPIRIGGSIRWRQSDVEKWIALGCPMNENLATDENLLTKQVIDQGDHATIQEGDSSSSSNSTLEGT